MIRLYEIIQKFLSYNRSYRPLNAIGGVQHETANPGDTADAEFDYFNSGSRGASAHAFIDWDSIIQCIPWDEQAWHAGPTANHNYWGVEMCHTSDPVRFNEIWKRAVWLWAYLLTDAEIFQVTQDNLMSHAQVSDAWQETDHIDPVEYFASFGLTMTDFREAVQKCIDTCIIDDVAIGRKVVMLVKRGDQGQAVADLQNKLRQLGYSLDIDGDFGPGTEAAVREFQRGNGLAADGIAGPMTIGYINSRIAELPPENSKPDQPPVEEPKTLGGFITELEALIEKYK